MTCAVLLLLVSIGFNASAQTIEGHSLTGNPGITRTVEDIMALEHFVPYTTLKMQHEHDVHLHKVPNPKAPAISSYPFVSNSDKRGGGSDEMQATQTIGQSWKAVTLATSGGWIPPDCNGAAGPTQILTCANTRIQLYSKTGTLGALNSDLTTFFSSVNGGSGVSDTHIRYDRLSQRWFVVTINVANSQNRICIAVSSGPTITNASSFTFFYFTDNVANEFFDYPTLGVDANALYIGGNRFSPGWAGSMVWVVQKSSILGAGPIVYTPFRTVASASTGIYTPQGVDNDDPTATEGYFVGSDAAAWSTLDFIRINNPGSTSPSATIMTSLTVPTTNAAIGQVSSGTTHALDALDDRPYAAHIMKNKLTGVSTLWTAHNIQVNSSGVASNSGGRNGSRWYQIGNMTGTPTLVQAGTLYDAAASNMRGYWIPSIAMSGQGHAVLTSSTASAVNYADVQIAGRYSCDALGTLQTSTLATSSTFAYGVQNSTQRWGDYTQVTVDPNDNMTMWAFTEYADASNDWAVRVVQLQAPPPPPTASLTPLSTIGCSTAWTVNVVASSTPNCSGFFDPGSGYLNHLSASVSGGITVNSTTFTDATHITLSLNSQLAGNGTYTITITNPDGQSTSISLSVDCSILPMELLSFDAKAIGAKCLVQWTTASEVNCDYFVLEKSKDGSSFEPPGRVKGSGNSTSLKEYSFVDKDIKSNVLYYRLAEYDYDGARSYSKIVRVTFDGGEFELANAYVDEGQTIHIFVNDNTSENIEYRLTDVLGKIISSGTYLTSRGINSFTVNGSNFSNGIYFLSIGNGEKVLSSKIFR